MAEEIERLVVSIGADVRALRKGLDRAALEANKAGRKIERSMRDSARGAEAAFARVRAAVAGVAAAIGATALARGVVEVNREFQELEATLGVFLGSTRQAEQAFEIIREFAAQTPFSVRELSAAFTRMVSVGINPTIRTLKAFGDVAAGTAGKSIIDFTEAVADAAVGEFERLKEFGIKASVEGDKVSLNFKGNTIEIERSSEAIIAALTEISETNFGGAAAAQMNTLTGAFSNVGDSADNFASRIGEAGLNDALVRLSQRIGAIIDANGSFADSIGRTLAAGLDMLPSIFEAVARGIKLATDNLRPLIALFAGYIAIQVGSAIVSNALAFVKLARALNLARAASIAFAIGQKVGRLGLIAMVSAIALVLGQFDALKKKLAEVAVVVGQELGITIDIVAEKLADLASAMGIDLGALEEDLKSFPLMVDMTGRSVEDLDEDLKKVIGTMNKAGESIGKAGDISVTTTDRLGRLAKTGEDVKTSMRDAAAAGLETLEDSILSLADSTKSLSESFRDMVSSMLKDLARLAIRQGVTGPLAGAVGGLFGGGSGGGSSGLVSGGRIFGLLDNILFGATGSPFAFANGGIAPSGPAIVGEKGPEIVDFGRTSRVFSNSDSKRMMGGGVTVNQTLQIGMGASDVRQVIYDEMPNIQRATTSAVLDAATRGGTAGRILR